jgi:hypothetical protein
MPLKITPFLYYLTCDECSGLASSTPPGALTGEVTHLESNNVELRKKKKKKKLMIIIITTMMRTTITTNDDDDVVVIIIISFIALRRNCWVDLTILPLHMT